MLYLIGLGLGDVEDITVKGLNAIKKSKRVFLEAYTSILGCGKDELEKFYGREIILADRDMVEQQSDQILQNAKTDDIAFLVVGDPFGATTHTDLVLRAKEEEIECKVIHNASIINAIGCCGLQLYSFGEIVSIPFWTETWRPDSFYDKIVENRKRGLHTLCLLDIKVKEQSIENLMKGRKIYDPPRFMTVSQAAQQLTEIVEERNKIAFEKGDDTEKKYSTEFLSEVAWSIGVARVGHDDQQIVCSTLSQMRDVNLGGPLHSLVIPGQLHPLEVDMVRYHVAQDADVFVAAFAQK